MILRVLPTNGTQKKHGLLILLIDLISLEHLKLRLKNIPRLSKQSF